MDDNKYLKVNFTYVDEFGQESTLNKTFSNCVLEDTEELEFLISEFKLFLISAGFANQSVDKITYQDNE